MSPVGHLMIMLFHSYSARTKFDILKVLAERVCFEKHVPFINPGSFCPSSSGSIMFLIWIMGDPCITFASMFSECYTLVTGRLLFHKTSFTCNTY